MRPSLPQLSPRTPTTLRSLRHRLVLLTVLVATVAATSVLTASAAAASVQLLRVEGANRVDTSVQLATSTWDSAPRVYLATAANYPDALAGASVAGQHDAPLLLTPGDHVPGVVLSALSRLGTSEAVLLGGPTAIAPAVADTLRERGIKVDRVAGSSRYETAAILATSLPVDDLPVVAVAAGDRADARDAWPDALSAASLAGLDVPVPTLLTGAGSLPGATRDALRHLAPDHVIVLGGDAAIGDEVVRAIADLGFSVGRVAGANRYATSVDVADRALSGVSGAGALDGRDAVFVSGEDFPDALGAGAMAAHRSAPLLLVPGDLLANSVDGFIRSDGTAFKRGTLVGGAASVSDHVAAELDAALNGQPRPAPPPPPCPPNSSPDCTYTYEHPIEQWERLAQCESGGNWHINSGNGYYGGLQFSLSTWRNVGGSGYPHEASKWEQIHRGELLHDSSGWGAWPSCSHTLGYR